MKRFEVTVMATAYQVMDIEADNACDAMAKACDCFDGHSADLTDIYAEDCILIEDDEKDEECDGQLSMWD